MKSKILHVVQSRPWLLWLAPLLWAAALFAASSLPGAAYPQVSFAFADKLVHLGVYAVFGALLAWAARANVRWRASRVWSFAVGLATLYGASDEIHQMFVPTRSPDVRDLLADALGAGIGAAFPLVLRALMKSTAPTERESEV